MAETHSQKQKRRRGKNLGALAEDPIQEKKNHGK
jgi:hypothetical protein